MSKINQWKEQYREIMEAFLELRDQFEDAEMVFDNMIGQITMSNTVHYTKMSELDNLCSQLSDADSQLLDFIYEVEEDLVLNVSDDQELQEAFYKVFFKSGTQLILNLYNTEEMFDNGTTEAVQITAGENVYFIPFDSLEALIQ